MTNGSIHSPCIKVCKIDEDQMCIGCGRTLSEIAAWSRMSLDEQRTVNEAAARRLRLQVSILTSSNRT